VGKVTHSELGLRANYSQGPLNVSLGYVKEKAKAGSIDVFAPKQTVIGANYNFGVARAFFTYTDASDEYLDVAKVDIDGYELGAAMPLGAVTLQGSFFRADYKAKIGGASGKADIDGYQLSALYSMSKRTTLYAVYGGTDTDYGRTRVGDRDSTEYGIGVRHSF
jgi:predicted porin